jgi:thiamine biosynthesis lipoprotein
MPTVAVPGRLMGTAAHLHLPGDLIRPVTELLDRLESLWSRFLPESDISRLNAASGHPVAIDIETIGLLRVMVGAHLATDGAFDPTLLAPLVGLGYGVSRDDPDRVSTIPPTATRRGDVTSMLIDHSTGEVALPPGTILDAGGIGKGRAADLAVEFALREGAPGAMVEIGGDLRVEGQPDDAEHWTIDVLSPDRSSVTTQVELTSGAVATSTDALRTWIHDGQRVHHLIDPSTGRATDNGVIACTVIAATATWAEALTKPAFVRGRAEALTLADRLGIAMMVTEANGSEHASDHWRTFARG